MKKRKSILFRFTLLFVCVIAVVFLGCFAFINHFLPTYYRHEKFKSMRLAYQKFVSLAEDLPGAAAAGAGDQTELVIVNGVAYGHRDKGPGTLPDFDDQNILGDREAVEEYTQMAYETVQRYSRAIMEAEHENGISVIVQISRDKCLSSYEVNSSWMMTRLNNLRMKYHLNAQSQDASIIEATEDYCLQYNTETSNNTDYIDMWGHLSDGVWFLMSTPVEHIQDSARISGRFYLYIGIAAIVLGSALSYVVMKRATKPIRELTGLSEKMSNLDFNAKYSGETESEIGILGKNMNLMSERLEETMSELKNANLELKKDIEKKNQIEQQRIDFISNVSHELKTPIALIQGYAEGLMEGVSDDPESMQYYCDVIVDESKKMNRLVTQLLSLNQLEAGNNRFDITRFDIIELLKGAIGAQEILMRQNDCYITMKQDEPIYVWGDEYKIEEVIMNYLSNAWNHLGGRKQISIDVSRLGENVRVSVYNTGKPIPEDELDRIWEKFYKVDKARSREYGGHGIGLSIVKAIMERHDGKCGAHNKEDGVVFWFEVKAVSAE